MNETIPSPARFDRAYWLSHCEGYRVRAGRRDVGVVEEVLLEGAFDRPPGLLVCGGLFGSRRTFVDLDHVSEIVPREQRIRLRSLDATD